MRFRIPNLKAVQHRELKRKAVQIMSRNHFVRIFVGLPVFLTLLLSVPAYSIHMRFSDEQLIRAPELKGDKGWLNTDKPLSIAGLRGKVILLDFWTYGCVNCIHIIPDLKALEEKYKKELVVIGVHSAKFENESENENIRRIILRYGIEHPVVNDADFRIWRSYAVRAWPTQVLIDPAGYIIGSVSGEGHLDELDQAIEAAASRFRSRGQLDEAPREYALERAKVGDLPLAFPGKVAVDSVSGRLFIADSNHNRIVVTDLRGKLLDIVGNGDASHADGSFGQAGFRKPQGMVLDGEDLYVADTENHLIRKVDLKSKRVTTIAGTGSLLGFNGFGGEGLETSLRSPWDIEKSGRFLYIAMAGSHQIWRMDPDGGYIAPYAGNRQESRKDGAIKNSNFAQPSGIVSDGKSLFVADSESNIIRRIDLAGETVSTVVGGDLFDFGDRDGYGDDVRLQHPLGITLYKGNILIADTYNHKIKQLDVGRRKVVTLVGTGEEGQDDGRKASFYEPGGICVAGDKLFIADTNNHAIRVFDLKTKSVSTLRIEGLAPPKPIVPDEVYPNQKLVNLGEISVRIAERNTLTVDVELPIGFHLNPNAPQRFEASFGNSENFIVEPPSHKFRKLPLEVAFRAKKEGTSSLTARLNIYYCREDNTGVCYIKTIVWNAKVRFRRENETNPKIELLTSLK